MNYILSVITSILLILSFPKFNLFFLSYVSFVPLFLCLLNIKAKTNKQLISKMKYPLIAGIIIYSGILYWIVYAFIASGESILLGIICLFLLSLYITIYLVFFCFILSKLKPLTLIKIFFLSCLWVLLEYIRTYLFSGFPWAILGYTQWNFLEIIQIADITGVYGVSFLIIFINLLLVDFIKNFRLNRIFIGIFLLLLYFTYGKICLNKNFYSENQIKISILQGNIDQYKKWNKQYIDEIKNTYSELVDKTLKEKPQLIIWPESSVPGYFINDKDIYNWVINLIKKTDCYHLIGSVSFMNNKYYNSCYLVSPYNYEIQSYSKIHLVPFGEVIPLRSFLLKYIKVLNDLGDITPGEKFSLFRIKKPPVNFSVNICFEAIFPDLIKKFAVIGSEFIVNITNDAWFLKTSAPYQHFIFNVFRAIENRKSVIRCANTGISGLIDQYGRIIYSTEIFTKTTKTFYVRTNQHKTFYTLYGNIFIFLCIIFICIYLLKNLCFHKIYY